MEWWTKSLALLVALVATFSGTGQICWADNAPTAAQEEMLQKFVNRAVEARRKLALEDMSKLQGEVDKTVGQDSGLKQRVDEAKGKALDHALEEWRAGFAKMCREFLIKAPDSASSMMAPTAKVETVVQGYHANREGKVVEALAIWNEALKPVLSEEQFKKWQAASSGVGDERQRKIARFLQPFLQQIHQQSVEKPENELAEIQVRLHLDEARVKRLKTAIDKLGKDAEDAWVEKQSKSLRNVSDEDLEKNPQQSSYQLMMEMSVGVTSVAKSPAWEQILSEVLSKEELDRWKNQKGGRKARFEAGMRNLTIAELDKDIFFTNEQRKKLEAPMAQALGVQPWFKSEDRLGRFYLSRSMLMAVAHGVKEDQIKSILDPSQLTRWKQSASRATQEPFLSDGISRRKRKATPPDKSEWASHREKLIADNIDQNSNQFRTNLQEFMKQEVSYVVRVSAPSPEAERQLEIAAKGSVERSVASQMRNFSSWVHSSVDGTPMDGLRSRLDNLANYRPHFQPADESLWKHALDTALTPPQKEALDTEMEARTRYLNGALAAVLLLDIDQKCGLSDEQFAKLEPLMIHSLEEYAPDISSWYNGDWYLNSPYRALPILGIPEADLAKVLSADQIKTIQGEISSYRSWWDQITRSHQSRVKGSKKSSKH